MGAVYDEFERELARLTQATAGDPRREIIRLFLLALEREEIVSVAYRESLMERRLAGMPIADEVRSIVRHALVWIWKDEEMHTIYIRGAILQLGGLRLRVQAILAQLGGWASSIMQHTRWSRAPLSRFLASAITWAGRMAGKVPADVRQHLQYGPFRQFCAFNMDAEKTAAVCWYRIADLAASQPDLAATLTRDFRRVAQDEDRHYGLFQILAQSFTDADTLAEGVTAESLAEQIRRIGEEYVPRAFRRQSALTNPLGSGQPVHVLRSSNPSEKRKLFHRLLVESGLAEAIARRAEFLGVPISDMTIAVKPTFMLGYHRRDLSPITDVELVKDLAGYVRALGCRDIVVVEGRNIYDRFFHNRGVHNVARYFGIESDGYRMVDTADEQVEHKYRRGMAQYTIAQSWHNAHFRISFPKIRSHPIELALLSLGNIEWVGGRCDEYLFLERQADRTTVTMMLLDEFPPHFAILDGFENVPDGLVGVMGSQKPVRPGRFYAGADALAVDTVALRQLGMCNPQQSSILETARHWFGTSHAKIQVIGEDSPVETWRGPYDELRALLSVMAYPVYVLGSGRGELFVPEMDEDAFPPITPEGPFLRMRRRAVRRLLGLRLPRAKRGETSS